MKHSIVSAAGICALLLFIPGCAPKSPDAAQCFKSNMEAPDWVCREMENAKMLLAVGTAQGEGRISDFTRSDAMQSARENLAWKISTGMLGNIEHFLRNSGGLDQQLARQVATGVVKDAAKNAVGGMKVLQRWEETPADRLYLLVGVERRYVDIMAKRSTAQALRRYSKRKEWSSMVQNPAFSFMPPVSAEATAPQSVPVQETVVLNEEVFGALSPYGEELEPLSFGVEEPVVEVVDDTIVGKNSRR